MSNDKEYELIQDDILVAGTSGPGAWKEMQHYAAMYGQDAPVEIYEVTRVKVYPVDQEASPANGAVGEILPDAFWELVADCGGTKDLGKNARLLQEWVKAYARAAVLAAGVEVA